MAGRDLLLNDSGDYTLGADGAFETTQTASSALRHQVLDDLGAWVGDPEAGRDKVEARQPKDSEATRELIADSLRLCLKPLEREGMIDETEISITRDQAGRSGFGARSRDTQTGKLIAAGTLGEFGV